MILKNCVVLNNDDAFAKSGGEFRLKKEQDGAFGFSKTITMQKPQKVYARVTVNLGGQLAKLRIGVLDNGEWYTEEKIGRGVKKLSVIRTCLSTMVDVIVTVEFADGVIVSDFITEVIGDTRIVKRILDKIEYSKSDIVNEWHGEPFRLESKNGKIVRKTINCKLEEGKIYFIKVLIDEITDCGKIRLECGHSQAEQRGQLVTAFKYIGRSPEIAIKGNKFDYIVDIQAIVIADSTTIPFAQFLGKEYWR